MNKTKWIGPEGVENEMQELFAIHIDEEGSYFAVREESPMFCLRGTSIQECTEMAEKAFEAIKLLKERK
ncbi:MAG: hypothetical protein CMO34_07975 [Verrucomicrobia bacterium]|nr:hypothetical protein [Verrucomicrobiota bacterium]|tara:strand:+ start:495 stop:701 length:207 start_codon:yes stop_codon:yes gene_type:complete